MLLMGNYLNILAQAGGYGTSIEDPVDFVAVDFEKGLRSEFVNKRVGYKQKKRNNDFVSEFKLSLGLFK
jgi:hypothetical protein